MAGIKPKVKTPAQMKAEMAVGRAKGVLPKAERDVNLGKMLEESAVKDRLYHGTTSDITEFDPNKARSKTGNINAVLGTFMSNNPAEASRYASEWGTTGGNVMPVYASLKNPYHASYKEMDDLAMGVYRRIRQDPDYDPNRSYRGFDKEGQKRTFEMLEKHEPGALQDAFDFKNKLIEAGHDGIIWDLNGNKEVIAFEPSQIKSAIGNQGTYDTSNPDITKAEGGEVKPPPVFEQAQVPFEEVRRQLGMKNGGTVHMAGGGKLPKVSAPSVMKRSGISELAEYIKNREGSYGERRVQRAADEIPKLGELYTQDALRSAFSGDNARALMTLKPADFEKYAAPLLTNLSQQSNDNIANLKAIQNVGGFSDVPFFLVNKELAGSTGLPWVTGHEGRHRNRAMDEAGVQAGLVQFLPRAELREPFPRRSQEQYIEAIRKEMELSGNKIKPEKYYLNENDEKSFQRPTIDLPDLYADGGAVKMKDGGDPEREFIEQMREGFSVYNKPTYGSEIPGTPTIDQQRYALSQQGQREAENRARVQKDSLTAIDPSGTLGVTDVLSTIGKGIAAIPVHAARQAMHWLQGGKQKDAPTGKDYEAWMQPKTQEGAEFLETLGEIPEKITGSTMGFGMHPNLWASGLGTPSVSQMRAGLKLGAERAAPVIGKIDQAVRTGYESGAIPQPGMSIKDVTPRVLAPANEQGFYSPTEAAALNLQRKSGSGQAFLNDLLKQENVRPDEIEAMGLDTFLKGKKDVTAAEVQDYIANNKIQLGEKTYKPDALRWDTDEDNNLVTENLTNPFKIVTEYGKTYVTNNRGDVFGYGDKTFPNRQAAQQFVEDIVRDEQLLTNSTKYGKYTLPGGENYREVVIKLPQKTESGYVTPNGAFFTEAEMADPNIRRTAERIGVVKGKRPIGDGYESPHWDDPNVLAHLRMSDRVTDGKKTLLVDEVQSDWHQEGREKGYKNDIDMPAMSADELLLDYGDKLSSGQKDYLKDFLSRWERAEQGTNENIRGQRLDNLSTEYESWAKRQKIAGVPDAPFKEDWYQLALKRAVKEAIDGGYDRVALPTGSRVAERFDLSKQIDRIDYNKNDDGTYSMSAIKGGKEVFSKERLDENELSGLVGKDVAKKIVGDEGKAQYDADIADELGVGVVKSLTGLDLQVGGKGMKKYYDEIYPGYLKKFGKKYGSTTGTTTVDVNGVAEPLHYMEITPAMREAFKTGIHMKRGGKVQFANNIDAMRLALSKG